MALYTMGHINSGINWGPSPYHGLNGPQEWSKFYRAYYSNGRNFYASGVANQWGTSEMTAVHYAIWLADIQFHGRPPGRLGRVLNAEIFATDVFRQKLINFGAYPWEKNLPWPADTFDPTGNPVDVVRSGLEVENLTP